jgi:hypothetical protein
MYILDFGTRILLKIIHDLSIDLIIMLRSTNWHLFNIFLCLNPKEKSINKYVFEGVDYMVSLFFGGSTICFFLFVLCCDVCILIYSNYSNITMDVSPIA